MQHEDDNNKNGFGDDLKSPDCCELVPLSPAPGKAWGVTLLSLLSALLLLFSAGLLLYVGLDYDAEHSVLYDVTALGLLGVFIWAWVHYSGLASRNRALARALQRRSLIVAGIQASDELHKAAVDSMPDSILLAYDESFQFMLAEGGGLVILGHEPEDIVGRTPEYVFSPGVAEDLQPHMQAALDGTMSTTEISYWDRTMEVRTMPLKYGDVGRAGLVLAYDVTAERQSVKALAEERRRMRTLISNMPGMVYRCVYDDQRTMEFVSDGCRDLVGYAPKEMILNREVSWPDLMHPEDISLVHEKQERALEEQRPYVADYRITTKDGEEKWVWERGVIMPLEKGGLMVMEGIVMDVSARRQAEEQARQREQQLLQADRLASLGTLVTGVAHEINNPNTVISLNAPMLEAIWGDALPLLDELYAQGREFTLVGAKWPAIRGEVKPLLDKVKSSSRRIRTIVSELKGFARHESRDLCTQVDLVEVARAAAELVESKIHRSTDNFSLHVPDEPVFVFGDFQRFEQVVVNALINACEALTTKSQSVELRVERADEIAHMVVIDQGEGMDPDTLAHALDPFFSTKQQQGGTGLGLAISHSIIEKHGGAITFESEPGHGTLCRISLTLVNEAAQCADALEGRR